MRDESILSWNVSRGLREEIKLLEKMLEGQPRAPMALKELLFEHLTGVTALSCCCPPMETYFTLLANLTYCRMLKVRLPSLLPWCRQCDQNGHIEYSRIPCGRCTGSHQTSACPITIMGMCVYCSAVGLHFSQLCPQRKYIPYCTQCGKSGHAEKDCSVCPP